MKLQCPKSKRHKRFYQGVHIATTIEVGADGEWRKDVKGEDSVVEDNTWGYSTCAICGTTADEIDDD